MHSLVLKLMKLANTPSLLSLGKKNNSPGEQCLKVLLSPYFLQILKADLDGIKFPRCSTLLKCIDDLLLFSLSQAFSQK